jgi:aconitase B
MLEGCRKHVEKRVVMGISPFAPNDGQSVAFIELLKTPPAEVEIP